MKGIKTGPIATKSFILSRSKIELFEFESLR